MFLLKRGVVSPTRAGISEVTSCVASRDSVYSEGRIEVCRSNQWGTMCDDFWTFKEAVVACRPLAYPTALAAFA
ncbi:hypothetical protein EMCRGX_G003849 [Ephydatia muelleri]